MKYTIREEGGFLGFPRDYTGEIQITNDEAQQLISAMQAGGETSKSEIRDALHYIIEIEHRGELFGASFEEQSLPGALREFLNNIRDNR